MYLCQADFHLQPLGRWMLCMKETRQTWISFWTTFFTMKWNLQYRWRWWRSPSLKHFGCIKGVLQLFLIVLPQSWGSHKRFHCRIKTCQSAEAWLISQPTDTHSDTAKSERACVAVKLCDRARSPACCTCLTRLLVILTTDWSLLDEAILDSILLWNVTLRNVFLKRVLSIKWKE